MQSRIKFLSKKKWANLAAVLFCAVVAGYIFWSTSGFVTAFRQIKYAHVFATSVNAVGWDNAQNALGQDLPPQAPFASFTEDNSAYIILGTSSPPTSGSTGSTGGSSGGGGGGGSAPAVVPPSEPDNSASGTATSTDVTSTTTPQSASTTPDESPPDESPPATSTPSGTATTTDTMPDTSGQDASSTSMLERVAPLVVAKINSYAMTVLSRMASVAFATTSDDSDTTSSTSITTTPSTVPDDSGASSTPPATAPPAAPAPATTPDDTSMTGVADCTVLGTTCHTIEFDGFTVGGSMLNKEFQKAVLNLSFAGLSSAGGTLSGKLEVRYFHAGQWQSAGEIYLDQALSNETNGGYFTETLDGISSWADFSDLKVVVEYEPGDGSGPVELYLDSLWVDGVYMDPVQDVMSGNVGNPSDAPANVSFAVTPQDTNDNTLVMDDGSIVNFPYLNTSSDTLVMRSDQSTYQAGSSTVAYVSITDTGQNADSFNLFAAFPGGAGSMTGLSQYLRDVPGSATTTQTSNLTYFCQSGWQTASTTGQYACPASNETYTCASFDSTGDNCTVSNVDVGTATSTDYGSAWVPMNIDPAASDNGGQNVPQGYAVADRSDKSFDILPGQTEYFEVTLAAPGTGNAAFVLSAQGGQYSGSLNAAGLRDETYLNARTKLKTVKPPSDYLNEQLSTTTDFNVDQLPTFHFKFKTQQSFFAQLKNLLTGTKVPYTVQSAELRHASGEVEHLPVNISYGQNDEWTLQLNKVPRDFRPGKYSIDLTMSEGGQTYTDTVNFYWGVLALNPDQSVYLPGQTAHLAITSLDDDGNTVCNANLALTVTDPSGASSDVPVVAGGGCGQNNVTTLPDYAAQYTPAGAGTYTLTLARLDDTGTIISTSVDSFEVDPDAPFSVARAGPTRVYPPSPYMMQFNVTAHQTFNGTIEETVPEGFTIINPGGATVRRADGVLYLDWSASLQPGDSTTLSYTFKVPQVSPYMYLLGPAKFMENGTTTFAETRSWRMAADSLPIATGVAWLQGTSTVVSGELNNASPTALSWNLSADYDGSYFSYSSSTPSELTVNQDGDYLVSLTLPVDRTSTGTRSTRVEADIYVDGVEQTFAVGRSAYISNQSSQKDSSDNVSVLLHGLHAGDYIEAYEFSPDTVNVNDNMEVTGAASLYAEYIDDSQTVYFGVGTTTNSGTNLNPTATSSVDWYDDPSAGRSDAGYSHSNSSSPQNIALGAAGYYLVYVNVPLSGAVTDANVRGRLLINGTMVPAGDFKQGFIANANGDAASSINWSGVVHATTTNENLSVTLEQEAATGTLTVGSNEASLYIQELPATGVYESRTLSLTSGTNWNVSPAQSASWTTEDIKDASYFTHSTSTNAQNITVDADGDYLLVYNDSRNAAVTRTNEIVSVAVNGTAVTGAVTKSHYISNAGGQTESSGALTFLLRNLTAGQTITVTSLQSAAAGTVPEDREAILMLWHKQAQSSFIEDTEHWYANVNAQTPTDPWPAGPTDIDEGDPISAGTPVNSGDVLRLRMSLTAAVNTIAGADSFKLQYAAGSTCSPALAWTDVGAIGSGSIWRGYDNAGVTAGSTLTTLVISVSSTTETYEEQNPSAVTPHSVVAGTDAEWDWVLQDNGAAAGTNYCFRMVESTGQVLDDYNDYPQLVTDGPPDTPTLITLFDNEKTASTSPSFDFQTSDPNGEDVHYEIQVSTDPAFGSTVIDDDSISNYAKFSDVDTPSDKAPFNSDDEIQYQSTATLTNGTTYWWRVRAQDPSGTDSWSSYSQAQSFTLDTSLTASAWFQTTQAQFTNDTLENIVTSGDQVQLTTGQNTGTTTSPAIYYSDATIGTAWGSFSWDDTQTAGTIHYHVEYQDNTGAWWLVPDTDLAGNAAGYTTGPVALSGLDTTTYNTLRVVAVFTRGTGTPSLQDWTVSWTNAVTQPVTVSPFDNEKPATTTPTFEFISTDPEGGTLVYQIEWSTDETFATGVSSSTSDTGAGFADVASSTKTSPFPSGDEISYTVQPGSALTNGNTYWWRARAKNPGGGYSLWSERQSFTIDTSVLSSTWFQTTSGQFDEDTLTRTIDTGDQVAVSSEVGQVAIYRSAGGGNLITTTPYVHTFDTTVRQDAIYSLTSSTSIALTAGYYAVFYGTRFDKSSGSNRAAIVTDLNLGGTDLPIGWSQGFIRNTGTATMGFASGGGIIDATTDGEILQLKSTRADVNTSMSVTRTANTDGIQLVRLDSSWPYLRLSKTSSQTGPISTSWMPVTYNREDDLSTGYYTFSPGSGNITILYPGHYLVFANTYGSINSNTRSEVEQKLTLNGTDVDGGYSTLYLRGNANSEQIYQGAASIGTIVDVTASSSVLNVDVARGDGTNPFTIDADPTGAYLNRTAITIVKLPEGADYIRLADTTGGNMNPATATPYPWSVEREKDTGSFTHSTVTNNSRVQVNVTDDYLFLTDLYALDASVVRSVYEQGWRINGGSLLQYGLTGNYNRDAGVTNSNDVGNWSGNIFSNLSSGSYVESVTQALATAGTQTATQQGMQGVRIGSLSEADTRAITLQSPDIDFTEGTGPKWGTLSVDATRPASTSVTLQVLYYNAASSTYALVPDSVLPGNAAGFSTSSVALGNLSHTTYGTLQALATFTCGGGNCPTLQDWTLNWSQGINISGTAKQFDQVTNVNSGDTVRVAVNGVLQSKTGTISGGTWSISNVTAFTGNVITVFVSTTTASARAVAVTKYETTGDISGMALYQTHLTLGSNDDPSLSNTDISQYDNSVAATSTVFDNVTGGNLSVCNVGGCTTSRLLILPGTTYEPGGNVTTPYLQIGGTLIADANTITVNKSWENDSVFVPDTSTVVFGATSTSETINSTLATTSAGFYNVTFGSGSGAATWSLLSSLSASGTLAVNYGTLYNGTSTLTLGGNLSIGASGAFAHGTGSTTFTGSGTNLWTDSTAGQDMGTVIVGGAGNTVQLGSAVKATNITINSGNTLDAGSGNYGITVLGNWTNNNIFTAHSGTVTFATTTTGNVVAPGSSNFYNLAFNGTGGNWSFSTSTLGINNNFTITAGTVTLPNGTTTIAGSFDGSGGAFLHNNGALLFTSSSAQTIHAGTSSFYDLAFNGSGSWSFTDTNATSSRNTTITAGTLTMPSGTLAVGGSLLNNGGSINNNSGTLKFTASTAQTIKLNGSSAYNLLFAGTGSWSFADTNATSTNTVTFQSGTTTLPSGVFASGASFISTGGTFANNNGTVAFYSTVTGKLVTPGSSKFYNLLVNSSSGGWTITQNATSTNNFTLNNAASFTVATGTTLEVDGTFTNNVGGANTWFNGAALYLNSGTNYTLNTKSTGGDVYGTLSLGANTNLRMWNSSAGTTTVASTASLYSMNHAGVSGTLDIWGAFTSAGTEYWSYANDFDGTPLGGSSRQVSVKIASSSTVSFTGTLNLVGTTTATTTVQNQGAGAYALSVSGGTINAQYYSIASTTAAGLSLLASTTVASLADGSYALSIPTGGTMLTVAASVINQNPLLQIQQDSFATTTGVSSGYNVTEVGTPISYWWFRNAYGNYWGESYNNDPGGNPGYIRWDNSGYNITVSGHVYADHGVTPIGSPTCDGSTPYVTVVVGASTFTGSCNTSTGAYSISGVTFTGDVDLVVYLNTNGGSRAVTVTKTPTATISNLDLYQNSLIVRQEGATPTTITDLAGFDSSKDSDIFFSASTSTNTLTLQPNTELYVWAGKTFAPGGNVTLQSGGSGDPRDGRLFMATSSTFTAVGAQTHSLGGGLTIESGATFTAASSTLIFTATTTGKSIYSAQPLTLYNLTFNGTGGQWSLDSGAGVSTTTVQHAFTMTAGTLVGTGDLVVQTGDVTGGGTITMTGGTFAVASTGNFGNSNAWQFKNLTLGDGVTTNTTTKTGTGTTTVSGILTVAANQTLNAGSSAWVLSGGGTPFVIGGTFNVQSAPFTYSATTATNVANANYAALTLAPSGAGSPTYTLGGGTPTIGSLTVGDGTHAVTVTADTNDPSIAVSGDMRINSGATYVASNVGAFNASGNWINNGTFTASGAGVLFNATTTSKTVAPGSSPFYQVTFDSTSGGWTITQNATSTNNFTLNNAASFTVATGTTLEVDGTFTNNVGGANTWFNGAALYLNSGTNYTLNTKSTGGDVYGTLSLGANTNLRMWNSSAGTTTVASTASLYSMNHAGVSGTLDIWGAYSRSSGSDYWSYDTDFDGTDITATPRKVNVAIASSSSLTFSGGVLDIIGTPTASTTITNQGTGAYSFAVSGGTLDAQYYELRNMDQNGLNLSGTPAITTLSNGDYQLAQTGATTMTVAASVINANPLLLSKYDKFATTTGVSSGYNVTEVGSPTSAWKFNLHYGNLAGEAFDNDPGGDPGYIIWDNSADQITVSGHVYSDEGSTPIGAGVCNGSQDVKLVVEGSTPYTASCDGVTGAYSISNVAFNPGDTLTLYLATSTAHAANVTIDPGTNLTLDLYQNRVIVRTEDATPITIAGMAQWDSNNDANVPFRAVATTSPNTLTLPPNTKLIVWTGKTFAPAGNVTIKSGGAANSYDGTLEVQASATFSAAGTQSHSIGGSLIFDSGASLTAANSTFTLTATTTGKTITPPGASSFYNLAFNGAGGNWAFSNNATTTNNFSVATGTVTLPTGFMTVGGSLTDSGGALIHNNGTVVLNSTAGGNSLQIGTTSSLYNLTFNGTGGAWSFIDTNATTSNNFTVTAGTVTLPAGTLNVGSNFINSGAFTASSGTVKFSSVATGKNIQAGGSNFNALLFNGAGGTWSFLDTNATTSSDFTVATGTVTLPAGRFAVGGSFINSGGVFNNNSGTVVFTATATGKSVAPRSSSFYNLVFDSSSGGWTLTQNATSTNVTLNNASSFVQASSTTFEVDGTFTNNVGSPATSFATSTLYLNSGTSYTLNTKTTGAATYGTLLLGANTNIRMWNSSAATTTVASTASLYSMNHAGVSGVLDIWGAYNRSSGTDYWDYATDFDGTALGGSSRQVTVKIASSSSVTLSGGKLDLVGSATASTTVENQGTGAYSFGVSGGTLNAQYYILRNTDSNGLNISGIPTISSLSNGDFLLAQNGGSTISVTGAAIDANAGLRSTTDSFATSSGITSGYNVTRTGTTVNSWTFSGAYGNYAGEAYDNDGGDSCGAIRWDNSACLFVNQAHYRWRNDDGGEGALSSQWYNASWSYRQQIVINNPNATSYTNYPVKIVVPYDPSMNANFSDLRFTDSTGTSSVPYFVESYAASASSTVWVSVPSLPASGSATLYMYYGDAGATDASSGSGTFNFFEGFESNTLSAYSGDTGYFQTGTSFVYNGTYGLYSSAAQLGNQTPNGMYRTGSLIAPGTTGKTIEYFQYVDTTQQDEPCALFGVQARAQNYAICLEEYPSTHKRVSIAKNVTSNDTSGTVLASTTVSYTTSGWYEVSVDWHPNGAINATVYAPGGSLFATANATDTSYSSGGMGFSDYGQHGGWDYYTARQFATTSPTALFGSKQGDNGATWVAAEDTPMTGLAIGQNIRLRFSVQNTGTSFASQFLLQYAPKGAALNCESVPSANYYQVQPQSNCVSSGAAACMTSSTQFTNLASTSPSLDYPSTMNFAPGYLMQDPSYETNSMTLGANSATEVEYNFQMTNNATDNAYCFRTTKAGSSLDNYDHIAQATILHAPSFSPTVTLNGLQPIYLTEGTTTLVQASSTVTDLNGYADMVGATSTFYRSGVGAQCTSNQSNCYPVATSSCTFSSCSGDSCTLTCSANLEYFADPTDIGTYAGQHWYAHMSVVDSTNLYGTATSSYSDVETLFGLALNTTNINFGSLNPGGDTGSTNASTTVQNTGNSPIDIDLSGGDLAGPGSNSIPVNSQEYATSTFAYASCAYCQFLTGTSTDVAVDIAKPSSTSSPATSNVFWGISVPVGKGSGAYTGTNTFTAVAPGG